MNAATTQESSWLSVLAINRAFASAVKGQYEKSVDRESAYEILQAHAQKQAADTSVQPINAGGRQRESVGRGAG